MFFERDKLNELRKRYYNAFKLSLARALIEDLRELGVSEKLLKEASKKIDEHAKKGNFNAVYKEVETLLNQVKEHHPDIWKSLGGPFASLIPDVNPLEDKLMPGKGKRTWIALIPKNLKRVQELVKNFAPDDFEGRLNKVLTALEKSSTYLQKEGFPRRVIVGEKKETELHPTLGAVVHIFPEERYLLPSKKDIEKAREVLEVLEKESADPKRLMEALTELHNLIEKGAVDPHLLLYQAEKEAEENRWKRERRMQFGDAGEILEWESKLYGTSKKEKEKKKIIREAQKKAGGIIEIYRQTTHATREEAEAEAERVKKILENALSSHGLRGIEMTIHIKRFGP